MNLFEGTGLREIVLNLRTGEFFPAEPVGFWTSGYRYALRIDVNFLVWVFPLGTAGLSTRKKTRASDPRARTPRGVQLVCSTAV